jgi:epsilon-lactone hydrolase
MKNLSRVTGRLLPGFAYLAAALAAVGPQAMAQTAGAGSLDVPAKSVPVPDTVSPQMQKIIGAPLRANWNIRPKTGEEWQPVAAAGAAAIIKNVPGMRERLHVTVEKTTIDGSGPSS